MGKEFLKSKPDQKKSGIVTLCAGMMITIAMGIGAYRDTALLKGYELPRNEAGYGAYEQEVIASIEGQKDIPVTVLVEERKLSEEEANAELEKGAVLLNALVLGENESLSEITKPLNFVDCIPDSPVEVEWSSQSFLFFDRNGKIKEDAKISEPVEVQISAILSCQEYFQDYEAVVRLLPKKTTEEENFREFVKAAEVSDPTKEVLTLPETYQGVFVTWKKPMDVTFLYFLCLTLGAFLFLKIGNRMDERTERQERREELERDYAQIVSKFTMLMSAGLSVRNAWERIVSVYLGKREEPRVIYEEMNLTLREMQKGVPELEAYERFGNRIGEIHYKKMMALFVSHKRRGGINLLEAMEQEMLQAWEEQKRRTRQQGEKIGTKLLLPMMGMLAVIFIIILVPAFLSFQL